MTPDSQRALEEALRFALAALSADHRTLGSRCGDDVCWLCAVESNLEAALGGLGRERDEEDPHVWIRFRHDPQGGMWICGDEDGEWAGATNPSGIMNYAYQLVIGPGNIRDGGLKEATAAPGSGQAEE